MALDIMQIRNMHEEDIPIVHKRDDDAVWFYGASFAAPALILALGIVVSRRSKKRGAA